MLEAEPSQVIGLQPRDRAKTGRCCDLPTQQYLFSYRLDDQCRSAAHSQSPLDGPGTVCHYLLGKIH